MKKLIGLLLAVLMIAGTVTAAPFSVAALDDGNEPSYVWFDNSGFGYDTVWTYFWNNGGEMQWPGFEMEHVSGDIYRAEIPDGMVHVIFSDNGSPQTDDLALQNEESIYTIDGWEKYPPEEPTAEPTEEPTEEPVNDITVYYDNTKAFLETPYFYVWDDSDNSPVT